MQLGMVGLGRMGGNIARRLLRAGHQCVVYDADSSAAHAEALARDERLEGFSDHVEDSGERRWTIEAAIEEAVPADVLSAALYVRFRSRQQHTFAEKPLSAMRLGFGGHVETPRA